MSDLLQNLQRELDIHQTDHSSSPKSIKKLLLESLNDLPSSAAVLQKLRVQMAKKNVNNRELADIIKTDQAFTLRVLKLVNSPFYGFAGKIVSLEEAVTILGFNAMHQLLITTSILTTFKVDNKALNISEFWKHSFGVGVVAKNLFYKADKDIQNESFMGGILHDIGRLLLLKTVPERFVVFHLKESVATDLKAEEECFGINHQKLGELLAQKWKLPGSISSVISRHHTPLQAGTHIRLVSAVNIADMLCHAMLIGESWNYYVSEFFPEAWRLLDLEIDELKIILKRANDEMEESEKMLSEYN